MSKAPLLCNSQCHNTQLVEALRTWPDWKLDIKMMPRVIGRLPGGATNLSYLIECDTHNHPEKQSSLKLQTTQKVILRINNSRSEKLGIIRSREHTILDALQTSGLSPILYYSAKDYAFSVIEYLPGRVWTEKDFLLPYQRRKLLKAIDTYQAYLPPIKHFDYVDYLKSYWHQYKKKNIQQAGHLSTQWHNFLVRLRQHQLHQSTWALVHHDLCPENVVEQNGNIKIIDWEYAGFGLAGLDKAYVNARAKTPKKLVPTTKPGLNDEIIFWLDRLWWGIC